MPGTPLLYISYVALWIIVLFQTLVLLELVRRVSQKHEEGNSRVIGEADFLESGTLAPSFKMPDVVTGRIVSSEVWHGQYTLLAFIKPNCPACKTAAKEMETMSQRVSGQLVVICRGDTSQCRDFGTRYFSDTLVLLDEDGKIGDRFKVKGTPTAILLDGEWRVRRYGFPHSDSEDNMASVSLDRDASGVAERVK